MILSLKVDVFGGGNQIFRNSGGVRFMGEERGNLKNSGGFKGEFKIRGRQQPPGSLCGSW